MSTFPRVRLDTLAVVFMLPGVGGTTWIPLGQRCLSPKGVPNMKKVLLAALAAIAVSAGFTDAYAQAISPHWVFEQGSFRTNLAALAAPLDSLYASGIAKFDTTASFSTAGWAPTGGVGSAVDSATVAHLFIYDAGLASVTVGKTSATAESIYIKTQVSADNAGWHDCAVIPGQAPVLNAFTVQTTVNAGVITFVSSTNTGISDKLWSLRFYKAQAGAGLRSGQDINNISDFPYVRFIIMGSRSLNHSYKVKLGHWSSNQSKQFDS